MPQQGLYVSFFKPLLDRLLALLALLMLGPVMLGVALLLLFYNQGKIFYTHLRPGLHGKLFRIYKFRTMRGITHDIGNDQLDAQRLTQLGKILRASSLDELPQLINVLKGDMSLIGPRPLLEEYLPLYSETQKRRHNVKPGITGWAQVQGRNLLAWEQQFEYDVWYADNVSFSVDLKIIYLTFLNLLRPKGISAPGSATRPKFRGTGKSGR